MTALRFWNFSFVPLWGISQGFQPAAGTNYGAKDYDRVKTLTRVFIIAATLLSLVFYIPAELFPEKILSMFLTTPGIAASGSTNFRIMFSTYILQGSFMIAVTLFQSLGKAKRPPGLCCSVRLFSLSALCGSANDRRHGYSRRVAGDCADRCDSGGYYRVHGGL